MANRYYKQFQGTLEAGVVKLYGSVTTTTSGTVGSTACKGFSVAKTAGEAGRYTVTLADPYIGLLSVHAVLVGTTDAAYTSGKGLVTFLRNVSVSTTGRTFDLQFANPIDETDAEVENAAKFLLEITLKNSQAY